MGASRSQAVAVANSWIGKKESDGSHKSIIDVYNKQTSKPRGYTLKYTDSWCAGMVTAIFQSLGAIDKIAPECSCGYMIADAKTKGIWNETDSRTPSVGDFIMYDWGDDGVGDNTGWPEHVGIVSEVNGNTFKVIEGNKSDAVGTRTMSVNGKYIRGFIVPKFDDETGEIVDVSVVLAVDGRWGAYTTARAQVVFGCKTVDGIVSNQSTTSKSKGYHEECSSGSWEWDDGANGSNLIKALQTYLNEAINAGLEVDGKCGPATIKALQKFLGVTVTGILDTATVKAFQVWLNAQ